jgi:hypothetical protein
MKHLGMLVLLLAVAFAMVRNKIAHTPYGYDEGDYMFAASMGMERNWFDIGSIPLTEFISIGRRRGADPTQRAGLSALARGASDPVFYRHWHGPLYYFWLTIPSYLSLDEHATRALSLVFPFLTVLAMYFGSLFILGGTTGQVGAILSSALFLWSPVTLETSELAPHMLFVLCYVCGLTMLAKAAAGGGRRFYYAAVVCAGLAFSTLEVALVFILVLAIFAWWQRAPLASDWPLARNSAGILIATILAAWPSGLLKLSFVKAWLGMLYLLVFRKGAWGNVTLAQSWADRFAISPVEWCLFAVALVLLIGTRNRRERDGAVTFLLFAALMVLATFRVYAPGPRYMTPFFPALELFTAWIIAPAIVRLSRPWLVYGSLAAICCLLIWNAERHLSGFLLREDPRPAEALVAVRTSGLEEKRLLVPSVDIPMLHYYFPRMRVKGYSSESEIAADRNGSHFDAVLYPDYSLRVEAAALRPWQIQSRRRA